MQWRLMAYDDAQRYRIGPNFGLLPANRPRCPVRNLRRDGCGQPRPILNQFVAGIKNRCKLTVLG